MNSQELFQETVPSGCEVAPREKPIRIVPVITVNTPENEIENRQDDDIDLVVFRCRD
ncbi:MAG: hypothetical protein LJE91_07220 [Gammaproteobacteria bacterium]|jgi:hypothetical protein|nr:hypothetical protein [Gammaproteobacteria bacterium]